MKKNFWSGRMKTILIAALVVAILAAVVLGLSSGASFFENVTGSILSPVRSAVAAIDRQFEKYYNYLFQYAKLEADNAALQSQVLSMEEDYKSAFTIGKGTNYGLEEGMCAITENGQVVGLITEVGFNWATVTTIMDSSLEISASIASSGYNGVVQGTFLQDGTSILRMNYLLTDAVIKNQDQVVTTGSTLYPRGLLLGYITNASLDETGVAKYATLDPSCDLGTLEQVFIITNYGYTVPEKRADETVVVDGETNADANAETAVDANAEAAADGANTADSPAQ